MARLRPEAKCYVSSRIYQHNVCAPHDSRYMGPPGSAPRVLTEIESFPTKYRNLERFSLQIKEGLLHGYKLKLIPDDSNQAYKDVTGALHSFFEQKTDLAATDVQQRLAEYLVNFDDDLPFRNIDFLADIVQKITRSYLTSCLLTSAMPSVVSMPFLTVSCS